jgi:tetratricopeptide (TPR) repeat protein
VVFLSVVGYGVLFLATSNLLYPIGTIMGERLAYSPSIFFCLLAGYALGALRRRSRSWAIGLVGVIMASYALLTIDRNRTWADPDTFFRTQVESAPESAKAHFSVGKRYHFAGETEKALHHYRRAVEILPDYPDVWNNMGGLYKDRGDLETALQFFQQTLSFHPEHPLALYNLGQIRQSQGDLERAAEAYRTVIRVDSTYVDAYNNLGVLYAAAGRFAEAAALWERALEIDPRQEAVRENLESLRLLMRSPGGEVAP